ncbi:diguanylate cyclase domain-containing protein [Alkalinema pantanalense CENA528]|uniref:sensor domain-containing diguanylate cyclase n=1 Tax=Alkalinema pantanalense TaxID=1620705 RepID=UPI003D6E875B
MRLSPFFKHDISSCQIPLRLILVLPFVLQIVASVGGVGWLSYINGQQAVNETASYLLSESANHIDRQLRNYLAIPEQAMANSELIIRNNKFSSSQVNQVNQLKSLESIFRRQLEIDPVLASLGLGLDNREAIGVERLPDNSLMVWNSGQSTQYALQSFYITNSGRRSKPINPTANFDPKKLPWYQAATKAKGIAWSPISPHVSGVTAYLYASQPLVLDSQRKSILFSSLNLSQINNFLREVKLSQRGQSFIIERSGLLVATSTSEKPFRPINQIHGAQRTSAIESIHPVTKAAAKYVMAEWPASVTLKRSHRREFLVSGNPYFLQIQPLRDSRGLDWLIVVVIPKADFAGQVNQNTQTTIIFSLSALVISIFASTIVSRIITEPLLNLLNVSQRIALSDFSQKAKVGPIAEFSVVARSFNQMIQEIQQSRRQLEEYSRLLEDKVSERTAKLQQEISERMVVESALQSANQELQRIAYIDGLTQVANRRHFDECLQAEWRRLERAGLPLSLILCDVDYFKAFNDTYGHQMGDECLRQVAAVLQRAVKRPGDIVARYGGEEFSIILPNTTARGAAQIVDRIQTKLSDLKIQHEQSQVSSWVTLSFGVATMVPLHDIDASKIVTIADHALYQAKLSGRNQAVTQEVAL